MLSSLLHVLIVTPVIFFWLHERRLEPPEEAAADTMERRRPVRRPALVALAAVLLLAASAIVWRQAHQGAAESTVPAGTIVQQVQAGDMQISLRSQTGTLRQGANVFTIEFRSAEGALVDAGNVHATANMRMPGMVMSGALEVHRTSVPGRYEASADFGMAGAWPIAIEWNGPAGRGSVEFEGTVQ
jgi:hypothetical protein